MGEVKIETFLGDVWEGTLVKHQRYLPKTARLLKCDYFTDSMINIHLYKTSKKYFIYIQK